MHNGRQHAQQDARIAAADAEAAADDKEVSTAIVCDDAAGRAGGKIVRASTGLKFRLLARRKARPLGSTKQSPAFRRTGSATASTESQRAPEITA